MLFSSKEILYAWAGGLFDGEGTIYCKDNKIRISVHMTDLDILETFKSNFGGVINDCKKQKDHHKQSWRWTLCATNAVSFLKNILPFLHSRRSLKASSTIELANKLAQDKEIRSKEILSLRQKIKDMRHLNMTHKQISIKLNVDRSYVTHTLNGDYD